MNKSIEIKLDEADEQARMTEDRLSHEVIKDLDDIVLQIVNQENGFFKNI